LLSRESNPVRRIEESGPKAAFARQFQFDVYRIGEIVLSSSSSFNL
jgi:hypothetical protein